MALCTEIRYNLILVGINERIQPSTYVSSKQIDLKVGVPMGARSLVEVLNMSQDLKEGLKKNWACDCAPKYRAVLSQSGHICAPNFGFSQADIAHTGGSLDPL